MKNTQRGFTAVELAVVVTVIGLIIGAIIIGQNVIRNAQLVSVVQDVERYKKAMLLFKDKYNYLPGDMPTATSIWGAANADPATCITTATYSAATCDGDGNGVVGSNRSFTMAAYEWFLVWKHLVNAGFIEGHFTGVSGSGGTSETAVGVNIPATKIDNAGLSFYYLPPIGVGAPNDFPGEYGHMFMFGTSDTANHSYNYNPAITPSEALSIDIKFDDGLPAFGNITTSKAFPHPNCTNNQDNDPSAARYDVTQKAVTCQLRFMTGF